MKRENCVFNEYSDEDEENISGLFIAVNLSGDNIENGIKLLKSMLR